MCWVAKKLQDCWIDILYGNKTFTRRDSCKLLEVCTRLIPNNGTSPTSTGLIQMTPYDGNENAKCRELKVHKGLIHLAINTFSFCDLVNLSMEFPSRLHVIRDNTNIDKKAGIVCHRVSYDSLNFHVCLTSTCPNIVQ